MIRFSHTLPLCSTTIDNPATYDLFKRREYAVNDDTVIIEPGAHPDLMSEAKYFWNATNRLIRFNDVDYKSNYIILQPKDQIVIAGFQRGANLTLGLPANFVDYAVDFKWTTMVTADDLNYILTWTNVKNLQIHDECNVAYNLLQRIDHMKAMVNLEQLSLDIHEYAMPQMTLKPFFENFPKLQQATFVFRNVSYFSIRKFLWYHPVPKEFKRIQISNGVVSYRRM